VTTPFTNDQQPAILHVDEKAFLMAHLRQLEAQDEAIEALRRSIKRQIGRVRKRLNLPKQEKAA
jgi:hypothetical protein